MNSKPSAAESLPERSASTAWQIVDDELILLRMKDDELLGLNEAGRRIWEMADGTRTIAQIAEALATEFDIPAESAAADARQFIEELAGIGAVTFRKA